jgi:hypothetical protein
MNLPISPDEASRIIAGAFSPYRCVAEPWDYDHAVRFRVFDESDKVLLTIERVVPTGYGSFGGLRSTIEGARSTLMSRGYKLDPWAMPPVPIDRS